MFFLMIYEQVDSFLSEYVVFNFMYFISVLIYVLVILRAKYKFDTLSISREWVPQVPLVLQ